MNKEKNATTSYIEKLENFESLIIGYTGDREELVNYLSAIATGIILGSQLNVNGSVTA